MKAIQLVCTLSVLVAPMPLLAQKEGRTAVRTTDPNAVRCRKIGVTGSLVRTEKICKTNAEWRAIAEGHNREADDFITRSRTGMNPSGA